MNNNRGRHTTQKFSRYSNPKSVVRQSRMCSRDVSSILRCQKLPNTAMGDAQCSFRCVSASLCLFGGVARPEGSKRGVFFSGWPSRGDVCLRRNSSTPGKTKTQRTQDRRPPWRRRGRPPYGASRRPMPAYDGLADSQHTAPPRPGRTRAEEGVEAEHRRPKWILHCKVKPPVNPCTFRVRRSNLNGLLDLHHCTSAPFNTI